MGFFLARLPILTQALHTFPCVPKINTREVQLCWRDLIVKNCRVTHKCILTNTHPLGLKTPDAFARTLCEGQRRNVEQLKVIGGCTRHASLWRRTGRARLLTCRWDRCGRIPGFDQQRESTLRGTNEDINVTEMDRFTYAKYLFT